MELSRLTIQPLKPEYQTDLGFELATAKTQNNGIDEIFFEHQGTRYVAFNPDTADISGIEEARHGLTLNGEPVRLMHSDDEHNHWKEKTWHTAGNILAEGIPDGIGGAAGAALVIKVGLKRDIVKTAAVIGFMTSFVKTAVSVGMTDQRAYQAPDWNNLQRFTASASSSRVSHTADTGQVSARPILVTTTTPPAQNQRPAVLGTAVVGSAQQSDTQAVVISRAGLRGTLGSLNQGN